jgi:hypothetical protein
MKTRTLLNLLGEVKTSRTFQDVMSNLFAVYEAVDEFYNNDLDEVVAILGSQSYTVWVDILTGLCEAFTNFDHVCTPHVHNGIMLDDRFTEVMGHRCWEIGDLIFNKIMHMEGVLATLWCFTHKVSERISDYSAKNLKQAFKDLLLDHLNGEDTLQYLLCFFAKADNSDEAQEKNTQCA